MAKARQKKDKRTGGWLFLGVMLLVYAVTAFVDISLARQSLIFFTAVLAQVVPVLVAVFVLMVLVNLFLTTERIRKYLGTTSGIKGWLLAIVGGILSTGPIYTWYILLSELKQQGMKASLVAVFLYSRAVKLPLLPLLIHYFGFTYTLILSCYLIIFSIISGIFMGMLTSESNTTG